MVTVGRIVRPHGTRGHVVVAPETDFADERFRARETVHLQRGTEVVALTVVESRPQAGRWIVGFEGVGSMDEAEALRDAELRIDAQAVRPLDAGAFYVYDLVGCEVRTVDGTPVGTVARVDLGAGIPMLVVEGRGEVLVPFVDDICRRVDPGGRLIEIDPPDGLVDLNRRTGSGG